MIYESTPSLSDCFSEALIPPSTGWSMFLLGFFLPVAATVHTVSSPVLQMKIQLKRDMSINVGTTRTIRVTLSL
jgi:hypothetical protein